MTLHLYHHPVTTTVTMVIVKTIISYVGGSIMAELRVFIAIIMELPPHRNLVVGPKEALVESDREAD